MPIPHPFPYQGSKRKLAALIVAHIPPHTQRIVEPFAGSAAVSIAAVHAERVQSALLNDINAPLMRLWHHILTSPNALADTYDTLWHAQLGREKAYYNTIREQFNLTHDPAKLLFLIVRCVKASVRYNAQGEFNQSPDNRRKGTRPLTMRRQLQRTSAVMSGRTQLRATDYRAILAEVTPHDFVYMDPPYQGVSSTRDTRYYSGVQFETFVQALVDLNQRHIPYMVSYDGRTGAKRYGKLLPPSLQLTRLELDAGRSSQATLLGQQEKTYESLYLSPSLI